MCGDRFVSREQSQCRGRDVLCPSDDPCPGLTNDPSELEDVLQQWRGGGAYDPYNILPEARVGVVP